MSSLIHNIANGVEGAADEMLGPGYSYASKIPAPSDLGVSSDGSVSSTFADIKAGMSYVDYLITGPNLGNKYFLNTGTTCAAPDGSEVDRYKYLDNSADQPKFSGLLNSSFSKFASNSLEGILPGIMVGLEDLNPLPIFEALVRDAVPPCQYVQCPVGDVTGGLSSQSRAVLASEASDLTANYGCSVTSGPEGFDSRASAGSADTLSAQWPVLMLIPIAAFLLAGAIRT